MQTLSIHDARALFLRAQGLAGKPDRGVPAVLRRLGAVQLDTISVLARSHELVAYARLGAVARESVERAYWSRPASAFEYWAHAACVLPIESWPLFEFRRRRRELKRKKAHREVIARLRSRGPSTAAELGSAGRKGDWWSWDPVKIAAEQLLHGGEVVCTERRGWRRVYDLAERAIPATLRASTPTDAECAAGLVKSAAERLGVGTLRDLREYYRLPRALVRPAIEAAGLVEVRVEGWSEPAWAAPRALRNPPPSTSRTTLLSPFDPVVWDRARTERLFGMSYRLESYTPAAKRVHGYFSMPLLHEGRLCGRVDPARDGDTLVAKRVTVERGSVGGMAVALKEAASWVGCTGVRVDGEEPAGLQRSLARAPSHGTRF